MPTGLLGEEAAVVAFAREISTAGRALSEEPVGDDGRGDGGGVAGAIVLGARCCRGETSKIG